MPSRVGQGAEAAWSRGGLESYATAGCRISLPGRGGFCGGTVTYKRQAYAEDDQGEPLPHRGVTEGAIAIATHSEGGTTTRYRKVGSAG